ncbi:META domain-containing protein [Flavobacterium algoritolerans]|uniref:META domain-containing protein n=1 Tax=Flavobacterium algoritolerans TaxID=3041254 RepID=A0ABT6V8N2_9FLAO|nr:META domain-containing protein [Flavobacterium algoritolerans]MDI5894593.1 META domain-containing protein [Flavobacterium algoritolerans]
MRKIILSLTVICLAFISCNSVKTITGKTASLEGTWELNYVTGPRIAFNGLYPNKKPTIIFDLKENRFSGNTSCNNYTGKLSVNGSTISFKEPMAVTRMMCLDGQGESVYLSTLEKSDSYSISEDGKTLNFIMGDIAMMRFEKK